MFNNIKTGIQQAFFDSLEKAGCLSLETENPDSSDEEEDEELEDDVDGSGGESEDGTDGDEDDSDEGEVSPLAKQSGHSGSDSRLYTRVVGFGSFLRQYPKTDKFPVERIHHIDIWCADALNTASRFSWALGIPTIAKSDLSTANHSFSSYALKCGEVMLCFTAPQSSFSTETPQPQPRIPFPSFNREQANSFLQQHGIGVRALAVEVADVSTAYAVSVTNGAKGVIEPVLVVDPVDGSSCWIAEVGLLGDVVLRFVRQQGGSTPFLPNFSQATSHVMSYGLSRVDHVVGAVTNLQETLQYIASFTGFHEFDAGSDASKLDRPDYSVLVNNNETILLPLISPGQEQEHGSKVRSFLHNNAGPGIQHIAITSSDIVQTVQEMRARSDLGGLQFYPRPSSRYYREVKMRLGTKISQQQMDKYQELGILVDVDDRGILLQIFTRPVSDRQTFSLEVVQRLSYKGATFPSVGCGGFGVNHAASLEIEGQSK